MILPRFKDVHGFGAKLEWLAYWVRGLFCVLALVIIAGCASDGVSIVFSGSTNTDVANLTIQESTKIPVIAYRSGPYLWAHTRKDYSGYVYFKGSCSVTNRTTALFGVYESEENKGLTIDGFITPVSTNDLNKITVK